MDTPDTRAVNKMFERLRETARMELERQAEEKRERARAEAAAAHLLGLILNSDLSTEDALNAVHKTRRPAGVESMVLDILTEMLFERLGEPDLQ